VKACGSHADGFEEATSMSSDLTLPSSEQIASNATIAITGASYTDSFAAGNPGEMYLSISDSSGDL